MAMEHTLGCPLDSGRTRENTTDRFRCAVNPINGELRPLADAFVS